MGIKNVMKEIQDTRGDLGVTPCHYCKKPTIPEFYCFGCQTVICESCDHETEWPPIGHTKPEQHPLRYKGKAKKMSKAKELQAENNNLKIQLAQAMRERDGWRNTANARQTDISSLSNTVTNYRQELWSQKAAHQRQLTQIKLDSQNAVIKAVDFCAQEAAAMLNDQARANQLEIVAAERDALGKALTYTIDNLTIQK
jgi:hypothetical protein